MPESILPHRPRCKVLLSNGKKVELEFREFCLADVAFLQREFATNKAQLEILKYNPDAVCRIIWHMLSPDSKKIFNDIRFEEFDEAREMVVERKIYGYEKLLHALKNPEQMIIAFECQMTSQSLNDYLPDDVKAKKKIEAPQ